MFFFTSAPSLLLQYNNGAIQNGAWRMRRPTVLWATLLALPWAGWWGWWSNGLRAWWLRQSWLQGECELCTRVRSVYQVLCHQGLDVQNRGGFSLGVLPQLDRQDKEDHLEKVSTGCWGWQLGKKGNTANTAGTGYARAGGSRDCPQQGGLLFGLGCSQDDGYKLTLKSYKKSLQESRGDSQRNSDVENSSATRPKLDCLHVPGSTEPKQDRKTACVLCKYQLSHLQEFPNEPWKAGRDSFSKSYCFFNV